MGILREICGEDELHYQLTRELIDVERQRRTMVRRAGLFKALEQSLRRGFYESAEDAEQLALARRQELDGARSSATEPDEMAAMIEPADLFVEGQNGGR
jgi:DNA sulfur modification protein DndC